MRSARALFGRPRCPARSRPRALALLFLLVTVGAGCGRPPRPSYPFGDAQAAIGAYRSTRQAVEVIRAEARVDQRGEEGRIRGTVLMFLVPPDRARFDAMTQFGPAAVLTSDGSRFQLLDLREDRFLYGPTCAENIARLLGISMAAEDVVRFLLGDAPLLAPAESRIEVVRGGYRIDRRAPNGREQRIELRLAEGDHEKPPEEQELRLRRVEMRDAEGELMWRTTYDDYRRVAPHRDAREGTEPALLPFVVRFEDPRAGRDVLLRFRSIDLGVEAPPAAFEQRPPGGVSIEEVGCEGGAIAAPAPMP